MTISDLARKLGLAKSTVSVFAKRGMPTCSIEAANSWRAINAPPRNVERAQKTRINVVVQEPQAHKVVTHLIEGNDDYNKTHLDNIETSLDSARESERLTKERLRLVFASGDATEIDKAQRNFTLAQKHRRWMEKERVNYYHEVGKILYVEEIAPIVLSPLQTIVRLLNAMPRSISPRCNNPASAMLAMEEYATRIRKAVQNEINKLNAQNELGSMEEN